MSEFAYANPGYLYRLMKEAMKAETRGLADRDMTARTIRALCDKLVARRPVSEQMTFEEVQEHLNKHLEGNRRR